jgi:LacI family transcriptional regulator
VATLAGVALGTASQALNGHAHVTAETRAKVQQAALKLGYRPHPMARRLASAATEAIGVLLPQQVSAVYSHLIYEVVLRGILQTVTPAHYNLIFASIAQGRRVQGESIVLPSIVEDRDVDGLLTLGLTDPRVLHELGRTGLPIVHIDTQGMVDTPVAVDNDDEHGAYLGTSHLLRLGHRRVGLIVDPIGDWFGEAVHRGYQRALGEVGIGVDRNLVQEAPMTSTDDGYEAMSALLALADPPTAIFACSDYPAIGAMQAVQAAGLRVPDDVAVVGMDDIELSAHVQPALTTVHIHYDRMGQLAAQVLLERIRGSGATPQREIVRPTLIVRRSCGADAAYGRKERRAR